MGRLFRNDSVLDGKLDSIITKVNTLDTLIDQLTARNGWRCLEKSNGAILAATTDDLFTIAGGPVLARVFGIVTTLIVGNANLTLQHTTTVPTGTVSLSTTVAVNDDAAGTSYSFVGVAAGTAAILTPVTAGATQFDPSTAEKNVAEFLLPIGTLQCLGSAARAGVIKWYITYLPLSENCVVTAAA